MKQSFLLLLFVFSAVSAGRAQDRPVYETKRLVGDAPTIDGMPTDSVWDQVGWDYLKYQVRPNDTLGATQKTAFKILYDAKNLYVAFRAFDDDPEKIEARLGRRDEFPGDWVEINFDSFNDKRTGFSFTSSASGVRGDEFISNDGNNWDSSWDPYWYMRSNVDSLGYTVEARIPFSQLRFGSADKQEWGLQVNRNYFRNQETNNWARLRQAQPGFVSRFGTLKGIEGIKPRKPLEFQPYVVGQLRTGGEFDADDPFSRRTDTRLTAGIDGRVGLTNDIAVDFTLNPDFGQVEADPGAINLDGFQIFFREQRPFFVENRNIFESQITRAEAGGPYNRDLLFYSRRIGGAPSRFLQADPVNGRYVQQPEATTIIGAAKVSGKTQQGLSLGLLSSVTERELATVLDVDEEQREVVEPFTTYNVGRVQQDFNNRQSSIGVMLTSVNRDLDGLEDLQFLHNSAYSGGLDLVHRWKDRDWQMRVNLVASQVRGSEASITRTQRSFEHLFQRPDANHLAVDTSLTRLTGTGGTFAIGNFADEWIFEAGATYRSPGLELNDIGFLTNTDQINAFAWGARVWRQPFSVFNRLQWNHNIYMGWDFDGSSLNRSYNTNVNANFKDFSFGRVFLNLEEQDINKNALRGGPLLRRSPGYYTGAFYRTDTRKLFRVGAYVNGGGSYDGVVKGLGMGLDFEYQPFDALGLSLGPGIERNERRDQFITIKTDGDRTEYVHGNIEQQTLFVTVRATYNLTPDFTVQYYAQPFIARGVYDNFNRVVDPLAKDFDDRFRSYTGEEITYDDTDGSFSVNDDGDGAVDYTFGDPDFNFIQFRSNMVLRWEYRPSSTLFFVWQQGLAGGGDPSQGVTETLFTDLFDQDVRNTFVVKASYRWVR